ncbi:MAG: DUF397 domain-containing protein [Hamadaea sp.]|nr:DUF397 domain-containing protein [Hamadaea sp.]
MRENPRIAWKRSQRCDSNACVEVAALDEHVLIRDSKDPDGPVLRFTRAEWEAFAGGLVDGDFVLFD